MANIKSAKKRVLVAERNKLINQTWKSRIRTIRNRVELAVKDSDLEKATTDLNSAYKVIDRAVSKGVIHTNRASRKKSQLARLVSTLSAS